MSKTDSFKPKSRYSSGITLECRDLLRGFRNPESLGRNSLANEVFRLAGKGSDQRLLLGDVISQALERLEPLEQSIARRCDVDAEPFATVAHDLGISERHLYRKRKQILQRLANLVVDCSRDSSRIYVESANSIEGQMQTSRVLEENGKADVAVAIIERIISRCSQTQKHSLILRLAELHARNDKFALANHCVDAATKLAREIPFGTGILAAEQLATRAFIFEECGQGEVAVAKAASCAVRLLYASNTYLYDAQAARVLLNALSLCGQSCANRGHTIELKQICERASDVFEHIQRPTDEQQMDMFFLNALQDTVCEGDTTSACIRLSRAAAVAKGAGLTRSAIMFTANLASIYRLQKQPSRASAILVELLPVARGIGNTNALLALLVDLAATYVDLCEYDCAQELLIEAATLKSSNESLRASMLRTSAKVNLASRQFTQALDDARSAESRFAAIGKQRLVGVPLRLEAEALLELGERRAALRAAKSSVEFTSVNGSRWALSEAYKVLGRITGDSKHLHTAKSLTTQGNTADRKAPVAPLE